MTAGFLSGPTVANITDTSVSVSGTVATYTLPVWSTIPGQTDDALSLPLTLDLTAYVTSQTPITAWGTDVGTVDANGLLTIPAGTLAGANLITVSATNSAGQASAAPFTWTVTYQEYFHDFSISDNTGWVHDRGSVATMHDYLGNIVTVNGTDADDEAFVGIEYTDPDTYVDHGVGYGIQLEAESTNDLLHSNDLSNAAWTLINATLATDVVTATAANGTVTQTVTAASGGHTFSVYVYPVAVTGVIEISAGNGVWVAVTPGGATRFDTTQTATNPVVGVRIANSGDSVRVRYAQLEVGKAFSSSYIATVAAPVTRADTNLTAPFSALSPLPAGGVVNDWCGQFTFRMGQDFSTLDTNTGFFMFYEAGIEDRFTGSSFNGTHLSFGFQSGSVWGPDVRVATSVVAGDVLDIRFRVSSSGFKAWVNGVEGTNAYSTPFALPLDQLVVGSASGPKSNVEHQYTRIIPAALTDEEITGWPTWSEPAPEITQQPQAIDFGGAPPPTATNELALLFSDLTDGKRSGWSLTEPNKGAAVTVWGTGLGSSQDQRKLLVGAYEVPPEDIVEWGVSGKPIPWLQMITFHLNASMPLGDTTVRVQDGAAQTESLPFHIRDTGRFRFININVTNGDGSYEAPYRHPDDYLKNNETQSGDITYVMEGTYVPESASHVMYGFSTRSVPGAPNNRCHIAAYPGHDVHLDQLSTGIEGNNGIYQFKSYWGFSKFQISSMYAAVSFSANNTDAQIELRVVGCDCEGVKIHGGGVGIITMQRPERNTTETASYMHGKVLGCTAHGCRSDHKLDHAVYLGGDFSQARGEIGWCWVYDNWLGEGASLSVNHQNTRVPDGHYCKGHDIHHNLVDTRTLSGSTKDAQSEGINVYDGGDNRYHTGEHPQPADPTRVFNNIIAGDPISVAVEARAALACSPRYMYVEFYNNTVIDFNSHGGFFIGRHAGVGERNAAYIFKGNVLQTSNSSAPYYVNNSTQNPTVTSSDNVYWGGLGGTAVPGDTNSVTGDPLIVSNAPTYTEFSVSNGSPVTGLAADYAIDMQTRDYNHRLYVDRYDSGAILADDEGG